MAALKPIGSAYLRCLWLGSLVLAGCVAGAALPSNTPVPVLGLRPEDRVVLGDFSQVNAIAATVDRVYILYPEALGIWRPLEQRWEPPRTPPEPGMLRGVTRAAIDPLDQTLWLATANGWVHFHPDADLWSREQPFSTLPGSPSLTQVLRSEPGLQARSGTMLLSPWLTRGNFTAVARSVGSPGWYLGTSVNGAFFYDGATLLSEHLPLGLPSEVVGAIHLGAGGLWVATDAGPLRPATITLLRANLETVEQVSGPSNGFPFSAVRGIYPDGTQLWLATDQGVALVGSNGVMEQWGRARGLPDSRAFALLHKRGRTLVGTLRGLVEIDQEGEIQSRDPDFQWPVYSLFGPGDTTWLATGNGVFAEVASEELLLRPLGDPASLPLREPFFGIGMVQDTLVALSQDRVYWRNPVTGSWQSGPSLGSSLGPLFAMDAGSNGVWVAGPRGVGVTRPGTTLQRSLTWPRDLPGEVTGVAAEPGWLWVATRAGLVRFRMTGR